eukprot:763318-Hanusia_phi.AAC.3
MSGSDVGSSRNLVDSNNVVVVPGACENMIAIYRNMNQRHLTRYLNNAVASFTKNLLEQAFGRKHANISVADLKDSHATNATKSRFYSNALVTLDRRKVNNSSLQGDVRKLSNSILSRNCAMYGLQVANLVREGETEMGKQMVFRGGTP